MSRTNPNQWNSRDRRSKQCIVVPSLSTKTLINDLKSQATTPETVIELKIPGVYFLFRNEEIVYVGQSRHVPGRIADHVREKRIPFDRVAFLRVPPEKLLETESYYIDLLWPEENRTGDRARVRKEVLEAEESFVDDCPELFLDTVDNI